ncbi:hypothetical protein [Kitasatospora sp. NPDC058046]|uniref:hypothetical protein n=1 Tax=Kitasatospora sp. NPDC058046 TaxID=3346312 RepID=UPI0036D83FCF
MTAPAGACRHCPLLERGHARQWTEAAGWHPWTPPAEQQLRDRARARLAAKEVQG